MGLLADMKQRLLDMTARKPSGWLGRFIYGRLSGGESGVVQALEALELSSDDTYLEIGQGGGLLLERVLRTVNSAAAIDHSADMVALAQANNRDAVEAGRLEVVQGQASELPWSDATFTRGACIAAFLFFDDPVAVLREIRRVLKPGGRFLILTPAKKKSPPFPKLVGGHQEAVRFYSPEQMTALLEGAGFRSHTVSVVSGRLHCLLVAA